MINTEKQLKSLGFHKNEIKVYLALFELGKVKAKKIIEYTDLHSNLVYQSLSQLEEKNLVSKVEQGNIFVFEANSPSSLLEMVEQKKNLAEQVIEELNKKQEETPRDIKVYEGMQGIRKARYRSLDLPEEEVVRVMGGSQLSATPEFENMWRTYHKKRINNNIDLRILFDQDTEKNILDWRNSQNNTEAKYLPFDARTPVWFEMYGDTLGVGVPTGDDPLLFSITNKDAVESLKKYFDYFWKQKNQILSGVQGVKKLCEKVLEEDSELYMINSGGEFLKTQEKQFQEFNKERIRKNINIKLLASPKIKDTEFDNLFLSKIKYLSQEHFSLNETWVFGNWMATVYWGQKPKIFLIEDEEVAEKYREYFESL